MAPFMNCYKCGQFGHTRADCPDQPSFPAAPPPEGAAATPIPGPPPMPVPADARAQYDETAPWAEWVRREMGWTRGSDETKRALAAQQVGEARAARPLI